MQKIVGILFCLLIAGCTTLQVSGKNDTDQNLVLRVKVKDGSANEDKYRETVSSSSSKGPETIGKFKHDTKVIVSLSLPTGGIVAETERLLPSKPDPYLMEVHATKIEAEVLDPTDAKTIERQITDVTNSCLSPSANIETLINANLGGVYELEDGEDVCKYTRIYDPTILESKTIYGEMYPAQYPPQYSLVLATNQANSAKLQAQVPNTIDLKSDFNASKLYKYEFEMKQTTWAMTPKSWYSVAINLKQSEKGKNILENIQSMLAKGKKLAYMDQAFFMGHVKMYVYTATSLDVDTKISKSNVFDAGVAYKWQKSEADTKEYNNLVLRVRYAPIKLIQDRGTMKVIADPIPLTKGQGKMPELKNM